MPFFSPPLKCSAYSDLAHCGAHKWLSEEQGMDEKKGGVKVQRKGSHRDSLSVIKFVGTQKEQQSHSQGHLEEKKGSFRRALFLCVSEHHHVSSSVHKVPVCSSLCSCNDRCSCLGPEAEPAFFFSNYYYLPVVKRS